MRKLTALIGLCLFFFVTACSSQQTNSKPFEQMAKASGENHLISYYETLELKEKIESSVIKKVFKKYGEPDGYEFNINRTAKEAVLVIRPISEKKYSTMAIELEKALYEALQGSEYSEYTVKVIPLWNKTNNTSRLIEEDNITKAVFQEMNSSQQMIVQPGIQFAATDGRIAVLDLTFTVNGAQITDPYQINQYAKEFYRLSAEKGFRADKADVYFLNNGNVDWRTKFIPAVVKGLKETEELPVTSVTIVSEKDPIIINTSFSSTDTSSRETVKRIEKLVNEFLQYEKIKKSFTGPISISVLGTDGTILNK
ncbi:hypothetical protein [Bacillus benzoevorans]|uniref:Uncharacterized protein n=1 Tax=Bacillus benzoevorans TaxID=1456 RepID=A0A7X0HTQ6_9BACI|nr:hypothetical protein [Bacillus benzoevorans]MBB6446694.1 hypothetical protein [Bacillus benzoevorans]